MNDSGSSRSIPFKSKKRLMDSPCSKPNPPSVAVPTPNQPEKMLTRSRNKSVALSVKEIRQVAGSRRRSEDLSGKASSAKTQLFFSEDSSSSSSKRNKITEKDNLPEKYEILGKFFDALDSSLVLSKLRGSKPTFYNISGKIEHLTERRFCYSHLAQIKHILPEAIEIKKVMMYDETIRCMKPDFYITLNADAVASDEMSNPKSENKKISLRKVFRTRLAEFVKAHPQGDEVPEEPLPELYNRKKPDETLKDEVKSVSSVMEEMASIPMSKLLPPPIKVALTPVKTASAPVKIASSPVKSTSSVQTPVKPVSILANVLSTPAKVQGRPVVVAATPPESASTPARLISTSRAALPQKRGSGSVKPDDVSVDSPAAKLARRATPRSLNFDKDAKVMDVKADEDIDQVPEEDASSDDDILSILPNSLRQAIKEQERKAMEEQNPAISEAKRRRKMIACLPKLFNVIHYLIQSIKRWVISKEELVHKIIAGHADMTDKKEVEEQLILMQELVPDWISEKLSSSGDLLVCINKSASPITIRSQLEEANKQAMAQPRP